MLYPKTGPLARHLYPKHLEFFRLGAQYGERLMMAANRVGKTFGVGAYELAAHLTGLYPSWWEGHRFDRPILAWAASNTATSTKNTVQLSLIGGYNVNQYFGAVPQQLITRRSSRHGVSGAYDEICVRHVSGQDSIVQFRSYDQGRERFQGMRVDYVWCDEEPPLDVYLECLQRTMSVGESGRGLMALTFTPLMGMSEVVSLFKTTDSHPNRVLVNATWDDVPHLSKEEKDRLWASLPVHDREARSKGIPYVSTGLVYPVNRESLECSYFDIPKDWRRTFALDVGWNNTAALWGAINPNDGVIYFYSEYLDGQKEVSSHAGAIKSRGVNFGVVDPAARGRNVHDGLRMIDIYREYGLDLSPADNSVNSGLWRTYELLSSGRIQVFSHLRHFWSEFATYRRDKNGKIVKENDHLMDCMRYFVMSAVSLARSNRSSQSSASVGY